MRSASMQDFHAGTRLSDRSQTVPHNSPHVGTSVPLLFFMSLLPHVMRFIFLFLFLFFAFQVVSRMIELVM